MIFRESDLAGLVVIEPERATDARGHFARTFCRETFRRHGLATEFVQCSTSYNRRRGTLRGLHYQAAPHEEAKLVRCTRGRLFDVAVDLRPGSPTRGRWASFELSAEDGRMLYIPEGFAHGFQTLSDDSEVFYQMSTPYRPEAVRAVRWDDPALAIPWPIAEPILSPRDQANPALDEPVA